jgi:hypothetical protein
MLDMMEYTQVRFDKFTTTIQDLAMEGAPPAWSIPCVVT